MGCILDETISGSMGHKLISKVNARQKLLHKKKRIFNSKLGRLLRNALIESHFGYAYSA